jgi:hypothetical protein
MKIEIVLEATIYSCTFTDIIRNYEVIIVIINSVSIEIIVINTIIEIDTIIA